MPERVPATLTNLTVPVAPIAVLIRRGLSFQRFSSNTSTVCLKIPLYPMLEGPMGIMNIQLRIHRTVSMTRKEGTKLMTQLAADAKGRRSSTTLIDSHLSTSIQSDVLPLTFPRANLRHHRGDRHGSSVQDRASTTVHDVALVHR